METDIPEHTIHCCLGSDPAWAQPGRDWATPAARGALGELHIHARAAWWQPSSRSQRPKRPNRTRSWAHAPRTLHSEAANQWTCWNKRRKWPQQMRSRKLCTRNTSGHSASIHKVSVQFYLFYFLHKQYFHVLNFFHYESIWNTIVSSMFLESVSKLVKEISGIWSNCALVDE